jgi:hypothetical protein
LRKGTPKKFGPKRTSFKRFICAQLFKFPNDKKHLISWFQNQSIKPAKGKKDSVIDNNFSGLAIWIAMELGDSILLPPIKRLFELGYKNIIVTILIVYIFF